MLFGIGADRVGDRVPERQLGVGDLQLGLEKGEPPFDMAGHGAIIGMPAMPSWPIIIRIMPIIGMPPAPAIAPPGIPDLAAAGGAARMMLVVLLLLGERRARNQSQDQHQ